MPAQQAKQTKCPYCDQFAVNPAGDALYRRDTTSGSVVPLTHVLDGQTVDFTFTICSVCERVQLLANGKRYYPTDVPNDLGLDGLPLDVKVKIIDALSIMDHMPGAAVAALRRILYDVCRAKGYQAASQGYQTAVGHRYVDFLISILTVALHGLARQVCLPNGQWIAPNQIAGPEDNINDDERVAYSLIYLIKQIC